MTANKLGNAAIWYTQDGFDPSAKGINGRRVAGESFLRGFLQYAEVPELVAMALGKADHEAFCASARKLRPNLPVRCVPMVSPTAIAPVGNLSYAAPNYSVECWRRGPYGQGAYSICGITHTTSTLAVMQGFMDLRMSPQAEWDAVICTSKSVQSSVLYQMDLIDDHIRSRFGVAPPPRPQMPLVPLGIHCDDFATVPAAGQALRKQLGAKSSDFVFSTIARLTPNAKFDPLPIYLALQAAQMRMGKGRRLFWTLCGVFQDEHSRSVFMNGAAAMMPDVGLLITDGRDAAARQAALSGADAFMFVIDNIQETFGLAPIEAMAAGLPVLVSDWDGMKDTVVPEVGFRVTSRTLKGIQAGHEALRYHGRLDNDTQYGAAVSSLTQIDVPELTQRIVDMASNPDVCARMGAEGKKRARSVYDWSKVIPQMQEVWAELDARREQGKSRAQSYPSHELPVAPSPFALFSSYPTEQISFGPERYVATNISGRPNLSSTIELRNFKSLGRMFEAPAHVGAVLRLIAASGDKGMDRAAIEAAVGQKSQTVERIMIWLLKYDFIRSHEEQAASS